jgi:putative peptidoglycan lipid II flippase
LALCFAIDKVLAIFRLVVILRQFGLSKGLDLDAFNVANNAPDMLFALISGGALAMAFIPVLSEVLSKEGRQKAWHLFSRIANLAFLVTALLAGIIALFAQPIVHFIIAPGLSPVRQELVVELMRLNLIATLIFSISGLVIAGLQSNQHFLLPALAPIFYNIGQLVGVTILAPSKGLEIGGFSLPAFGLGEKGMVYGVILGAALHLLIQIPGLFRLRFSWIPRIDLKNPEVRKVLKLLGPRILTMFFIQFTFIIRDNLASHLALGDISALTYGWMIQQVPETLIGTAIGTALLPALSEMVANEKRDEFIETIHRAFRVLLGLTIPIAVIFSAGLNPLLTLAFGLGVGGTNLLLWVTRGFLLGLTGHSLKEVSARSFYALQDARTPLWTSVGTVGFYALIGFLLMRFIGAAGISLADSLAFTIEALVLITLLNIRIKRQDKAIQSPWTKIKLAFANGGMVRSTMIRALLGSILSGGCIIAFQYWIGNRYPLILNGVASMLLGVAVAVPFFWKELRQLLHL